MTTARASNLNDDSTDLAQKSVPTAQPNISNSCESYPITATVDTGKHGNGGCLNLRVEASKTSLIIARIPNGASIDVHAMEGEWLAARYGSHTGYVMAEYVIDSEAYGLDIGALSNVSISQKIETYSTLNREKNDHISTAQFFTNLDYYAALRTVRYKSAGTNGKAPNYTAMCCASYLRISREYQGGRGATTEYNQFAATSALKGTIANLGGYDFLIPGMEIFQASTADSSQKAHIGVYYGLFDFGHGFEHAVYQSTTTRTKLLAKYEDGNKEGPNLTQMNSRWTHWIWSRYVVQKK